MMAMASRKSSQAARQATIQLVVGGKLTLGSTTAIPKQPTLTDADIETKAKIFGKDGNTLNKYQRNIDDAAATVAKQDSTRLHNKGELLIKARQ